MLRAREVVLTRIRPMLADAGVTEQQWRVLRVLAEEGPLDPTDIAEKSSLLLPSLTRILKYLEEQALVKRAAHETDGRRCVIYITEEGRQLIEDNIQINNSIYVDLENAFGKKKLSELLDLLNDLARLKS
nr:homoprotocatechuate degradation operon regulator HpaR [Hoeflea prorocentri]